MDVLRYDNPGVAPVEADNGFHFLVNNVPVMIWRSDADQQYEWCNKPRLDFTGRTFQEEAGFGWVRGLHPEDYDRYLAAFSAAFKARRPFTIDYRLRRHDGVYRWVRDNGTPCLDDSGRLAGYMGSGVDVTDHMETQSQLREAIRQQQILVDEFNHRTKNIAASIQSIAYQTLRRADVDRDIIDKLESRLISLAHAHSLLARRDIEGVSLKALISRILLPYDWDQDGKSRITLRGEDVALPSNWVMLLGLAIHELATNASKYGALSVEQGRVLLAWTPVHTDEGGAISFEWRELDGPRVSEPCGKGFGMSLMERGIGGELGGDINLQFLPEGVVWQAEIPVREEAVRFS